MPRSPRSAASTPAEPVANAAVRDTAPAARGWPGVGPQLAGLLAKLDIRGPQDLLLHLPLRYEDETRLTPIAAARPGFAVQVEGEVQSS